MTNGKLTDYGAVNVKHILETFNRSGAELKKISLIRQRIKAKEAEDRSKIHSAFCTTRRDLEATRDAALDSLYVECEDNCNAYDGVVIKHAANIQKVDRIIHFLQLDPKSDLEWEDKTVQCPYNCREKDYFETLGYLFNDEFMKIKLYLFENTKPKNQYRLAAVGKTLFYKESILSLPYCYGVDLNTMNAGFNIVKGLRDLPEINDIKAWLAKNREKILQKEIKQYKQVKEEYQETIKNYDIKDFEEIIKENGNQ